MYSKYIKKRQYKLSDLQEQFFIDLIIYLRDKHDLYDNTLNRYISVIKTFLTLGVLKKGYSPPMDFTEVRIKKHETDDVALTREEVELIANAELSGAKDRARDLFFNWCLFWSAFGVITLYLIKQMLETDSYIKELKKPALYLRYHYTLN